MSGTVLFIGDPHGDLARVRGIVRWHQPSAIVLLGDIEVSTTLDQELAPVLDAGVQVAWIHGNHDNDRPENWAALTDPRRNPRTACGGLHGRVVDWAGTRVAGLGGVFKRRVWDPRAAVMSVDAIQDLRQLRRLHPEMIRDAIEPDTVDALAKLRAEVLACHEAPSSHLYGFEAVDRLARSMRARMVVHGHHHCDYAAVPEADGLLAVGVAPLSAVDQDGNLVEEGPRERRRQPGLPTSGWRRIR